MNKCPFCRNNTLLKEEIITFTNRAFVIEPNSQPGSYLIIPEPHVESLEDLPDDWWREVKRLLASIPDLHDYNLSINLGEAAGQRVKHLHFWIIPRAGGQASTGKGLAALIAETNQTD